MWRAETKGPRVAFPEDKGPLQPGYVYRWEVTDQDFRKVAEGEFTAATPSERSQLDELKALAESGDRADRRAVARSYRRLAAYADAITAYEGLVRESPGNPDDRKALADLYRLAGRPADADAVEAGKPLEPK